MVIEAIALAIGLLLLYKMTRMFSPSALTIDSQKNQDKPFTREELAGLHALFFDTVFVLLGFIARRDGRINEHEIKKTETYMEKMGLSAVRKREAIALFKQGATPGFQADTTITNFQRLANKSPNLTQILLVYLVGLARVDGPLKTGEIEGVQLIANGLGFKSIAFEHLLKMTSMQNRFSDQYAEFVSSQDAKSNQKTQTNNKTQQNEGAQANQKTKPNDNAKESSGSEKNQQDSGQKWKGFANEDERHECAYDALGLTPYATNEQVKKAYRQFASQYHPDKLIAQGSPPDMVAASTERFKTIQSAYDCIRRKRGLR